ncbi:alpha/beta fold hydrolase [Halomicrobium salinisoli]|uniref:alpha/beta fold hydrolase n=1 Tax=Halomicrobium salinisoli TaxID=2878391 RepID=UPI001CF0C4CA|nr:alpha/beta hydrolase [Halomicrobium salinisoli]
MRLRTLLAGAAGTVGAAALGNRALSARADDLEPFLPGDHRTYRWRGFEVAYDEIGDPDDPDLVLFHGINAAASNHEFYRIFEALGEDYHVLAPDLPGFGRSDRPPLLYSSSLLSTFVEEFLADESERPIVVGSSLTGAYAAMAAREVPVERLVLIAPTDTSMGGRRTWVRSLLRSPVVGQALHNLVVSEAGLRHFHEDHGYYDVDNLDDEVLAHEWRTAHQSGARFAPASFLAGFLDPDEDLSDVLRDVDAPVTLVWGREADVTPLSDGKTLAEEVDARLIVFDETLLLPHVEHPEQFADVVREEYEQVTVRADQ